MPMSATEHFELIDPEKAAELARRMHPGMDRRALRTRQALHQTLIRLIIERNYDEVTVADIAAGANVGRSTFYAHFTDKDDLLRNGVGHLKAMLMRPPEPISDGEASPLGFSRFLTAHLKEQKQLYQAMMRSSAGAIILESLRQSLCEVVRRELGLSNEKSASELSVQFVVGAYMSVVTWWLDRGARESPEQIDSAFRELACRAIGERSRQ
jgi:AcrR family transcriptional regulator